VPLLFASTDVLVGTGTLALAVATFLLALIAVRQLIELRKERETTEASLELAERTFRAQFRPELIALRQTSESGSRQVHVATYGSLDKPLGAVEVGLHMMDAQVAIVSFDVSNIGEGAAEITRTRIMSLDTLREGGDPVYWEAHPADTAPIVVPAAGWAAIDLILAPQPPGWFYGQIDKGLKFWVEVTYSDLSEIETYVRWFEFWQRPDASRSWFIGEVVRQPPRGADVPMWSGSPAHPCHTRERP
jgi:hypothetical protein